MTELITTHIAGTMHYVKPNDIKSYVPGIELTAEPEPSNKFDSHAVKLLAPNGTQLGYIPMTHSKIVFLLLTVAKLKLRFFLSGAVYSDTKSPYILSIRLA